MQDMKLKDQIATHENARNEKMTDQFARRENVGHEISGHEKAGPCWMRSLYRLL